MTQRFQLHPEDPQLRLTHQIVEALKKGAVIAYPTDSAYALGCQIGNKEAQERIRKIRHLNEQHNFTLICCDLSDLSKYAYVTTPIFRLLKAYTPGPYTFILPATKEVPRRLQHPKRKTIGLRIPEHAVTQAILKELNEPLMSVTLILPGEELALADPEEIYQKLKGQIDILVDCGICGVDPTTVVDLVEGTPQVLRKGKGDPRPFE